jgi:predicted Zn-dependent protease
MRAAEGWLDLDEAVEAAGELEQMTPESRSHPIVLLLRCRIYLATHRPHTTHVIASRITERAPEIPDGWFYLACACSRLNRNEEAGVALEQCFKAATQKGEEKEWKQRALSERDLDGYWAKNQKNR